MPSCTRRRPSITSPSFLFGLRRRSPLHSSANKLGGKFGLRQQREHVACNRRFTYSPTAYQGARLTVGVLQPMTGINNYSGAAGGGGDIVTSIDQLLAAFLPVQRSRSSSRGFSTLKTPPPAMFIPRQPNINPTPYQSFEYWNGSVGRRPVAVLQPDGIVLWAHPDLADQRVLHLWRHALGSIHHPLHPILKGKGLRVVFYPFLLGDIPGSNPWRGRITYCPEINPSTGLPANPDVSSAASAAVASFLGSAAISQFTRDMTNLTVSYSGSPTDWTFRRMILHYANLCVVAGGVDLFLLGSQSEVLRQFAVPRTNRSRSAPDLRRVEYPFVSGLATLASDVRSIFDGAGNARDPTGLHNLISYAADW